MKTIAEFIASERNVNIRLSDGDFTWIDAPLLNRVESIDDRGTHTHITPDESHLDKRVVRALFGDLMVEREFADETSYLQEQISIANRGTETIRLNSAIFGIQRRFMDSGGKFDDSDLNDRFTAIPFRRAPWEERLREWSVEDLRREPGREWRMYIDIYHVYLPFWQHQAEGWAWSHGNRCLAVLTGNDNAIQYGACAPISEPDGMAIGIGAALPGTGQHGIVLELGPGESMDCGTVRYVCLNGDFEGAMLAYRDWLDERGMRFPIDYNPPFQWNELYDNPEWSVTTGAPPPSGWLGRSTRSQLYTRTAMEAEAKKASAHECESIYLDPGWDTQFGTFVWDDKRLGRAEDFVSDMLDQFGLKVAIHCPVAPWMSRDSAESVESWPIEAARIDADGREVELAPVCLASSQYLDEAESRLLVLCKAGVSFIMLDGTFWMGSCSNKAHGHPVPSTFADHISACLELARRIKSRYPDVLIEMHDPISGGSRPRWTPIYYGYDPVRCFDENWGFELMWQPFDDLYTGRARSLYYYALSSNVPIYLHIDLRDDNEHATAFWWFASTCRHLGIGGTHHDVNVVNGHLHAAKRYRELDRFFKTGRFYGIGEEIHVHVLPEERAFVVNVFNLTDERRTISDRKDLASFEIDSGLWYTRRPSGVSMDSETGELVVSCELPPWGNKLFELRAVE
jgi:hypothetical protein